jgi:hypothetical protein
MFSFVSVDQLMQDFKNVAALVDIVNTKKDAKAVDYTHRIIRDLDKWVYDNKRSSEEASHFGATHGANVGDIEEYIKTRPNEPAIVFDTTPPPSDPWEAFLVKIKTKADVKRYLEPAYGS